MTTCKLLSGVCLLLIVLAVFENVLVITVYDHLLSTGVVGIHNRQTGITRAQEYAGNKFMADIHYHHNGSTKFRQDSRYNSNSTGNRSDPHPKNSFTGVRLDNHTFFRTGPSSTPSNMLSLQPDISSKSLNILALLKRWNDTTQPFFDKRTPVLKQSASEPPKGRCSPSVLKKLKAFSIKEQQKILECKNSTPRQLSPFELNGNHILFTIRTTLSLHAKRLPLLFHTWLSTVNRSNVIIVTDGHDKVLEHRAKEAGIRTHISVPGYTRLCEKAGDELSLLFAPGHTQYKWICHVDDDMYVNLNILIKMLSKLNEKEKIYFGRSGTPFDSPREVKSGGGMYHFAVGGFYCLSRPLLQKAKLLIGNRDKFQLMCSMADEPEDVTVGFVVKILLGLELHRSLLICPHGLFLDKDCPNNYLKHMVAVSYGFGSTRWMNIPYNVVKVPDKLFTPKDDDSQFLSLHCYYYPFLGWCVHKSNHNPSNETYKPEKKTPVHSAIMKRIKKPNT